LHNSYRGLGVTQRQGEAYFALQPLKVKASELPPPSRRTERKIIRLRRERAKYESSEKIAQQRDA
jgi:hypothetical protein